MAMGLYNIAMVSDYFHPKVGGVESHIYMLSQRLIRLGHKVIVITHSYPPKPSLTGIRHLSSGLKVYYLPVRPLPPSSVGATLPNLFLLLPLLRSIVIREKIDIIHGHAALSSMALESILHGRTMGIKCVFTDHSLFGLGKGGVGEMAGNKMLKAILADIDAVICVSHTGRENTVLRASLDPRLVHVIPNAVVASQFKPDPSSGSVTPTSDEQRVVNIVCLSRLVYRKGIDLLIAALPRVLQKDPNVTFIIGGDGPKIVEMEQMREKHQTLLSDKVELLGSVRHAQVRKVLTRGDIFLNTSLTEAFGIGILEAACCGLFVVSTRVGGVPEVLPKELVEFAEPVWKVNLVSAIHRAVSHIRSGEHDPAEAHGMVRKMYSWANVARRTERVYDLAMGTETPSFVDRLERYYGCGLYFGKIFCMVAAVDLLFILFLQWLLPAKEMDVAPAFRIDKLEQLCEEELEDRLNHDG